MAEEHGRFSTAVASHSHYVLSLPFHLNVGPAGENTSAWWERKAKWVIIAILSPEIMLYTPGKQWSSASRLCKKLNSWAIHEQTEVPPKEMMRPFWSRSERPVRAPPLQAPQESSHSLMYGFFVTMGGFLVDVSHLHNTLSRLTITPKGIAFLARHGHFVKISDAAIKDESKADLLAKGLVCIQVTWTLVQTVSRRIVGYPITLLEVHTLVHVACAIGMYGRWFQKASRRTRSFMDRYLGLRRPDCVHVGPELRIRSPC